MYKTMDEEQMRYYKMMTEKIFSIPAGEREQYLAEIKKRDGEFYERIEHLARFLTSREDLLKNYAPHQIRHILSDLKEPPDE
jgi:hypothetical protein